VSLWLLLTLAAMPADAGLESHWGHLWSVRLQAAASSQEQMSTPVIDEGAEVPRVIVGTEAGELISVDLVTGETVWKRSFKGRISSRPVLFRRAVFVSGADGQLRAFHADTGEDVWTVRLGSEPAAAPVIVGERLFVQNSLDAMLVLNVFTGEEQWRCDRYEDGGRPQTVTVFGHTRPTPVLLPVADRGQASTVVLVGGSDGSVSAYNANPDDAECETVWTRNLGRKGRDFPDVDAGPVVLDGVIYTASYNGGLYALRLGDGQVVWQRAKLVGVHGIAADADRLYLAARGRIAAVDKKTGATIWKRTIDGGIPTRPVVRNGVLWIGQSGGAMVRYEASSGAVLQQFDPGTGFSSGPQVGNRLALLFSNGGVLYLLGRAVQDAIQ
jgi:outer membrane protein assembly factor BamB